MTDMQATVTTVADFEITGWDAQDTEDEATEGAAIGRTVVSKRFTGALEGTSVTQLLTAVAATGRGYVAIERIDGVLDGHRGTFVIQHGGLADGDTEPTSFGAVVPGSGPGELTGLRGDARYLHEADVARLTLVYALPGG